MFDDIAFDGDGLALEGSDLVFEAAGDVEGDFGAGEFELFNQNLLIVHGDGADYGLGFAFRFGGGAGDEGDGCEEEDFFHFCFLKVTQLLHWLLINSMYILLLGCRNCFCRQPPNKNSDCCSSGQY